MWLKLIGYDDPENLKIIKNQNLETQALTWRTFWHALYADEDRISTKKPILLPLQTSAQPAFKCALASLITGKDYAAYARDESVETRKLRNNAIIAVQAEREQHLERKQAIKDKLEERKNRTLPKGNFNPLDEYPKTFWPRMGTNLLDILGPARSPDSKMPDSRVNCSMMSSTAKPKRRKGRATGGCQHRCHARSPGIPHLRGHHTQPWPVHHRHPHYCGSTIHSSTTSFKKPAKPSPLPSTITLPSNKTAVR